MFFRVLAAQMAFFGLLFRWPRFDSSKPVLTLTRKAKSYINTTILSLSVASLLVTMYRWPVNTPAPYRPGPRIFRAGIWTVHFGIDDAGRDSQRRMRDLIKYAYKNN